MRLEGFLEEEALELGLEGHVDLERWRDRTTGDGQRQKQRESWEAKSESFSGPDYRGLASNPQYPKPVDGSRTLRRLDVCSPCVLPPWRSPSPVFACKRQGSFTQWMGCSPFCKKLRKLAQVPVAEKG